MRIDPSKSQSISRQTVERTEKARAGSGVNRTEGAAGQLDSDRVALSQQAKDIQLARDALANTPEVRYEKVQEFKARIASGGYEVDSKEVARKLLSGD